MQPHSGGQKMVPCFSSQPTNEQQTKRSRTRTMAIFHFPFAFKTTNTAKLIIKNVKLCLKHPPHHRAVIASTRQEAKVARWSENGHQFNGRQVFPEPPHRGVANKNPIGRIFSRHDKAPNDVQQRNRMIFFQFSPATHTHTHEATNWRARGKAGQTLRAAL